MKKPIRRFTVSVDGSKLNVIADEPTRRWSITQAMKMQRLLGLLMREVHTKAIVDRNETHTPLTEEGTWSADNIAERWRAILCDAFPYQRFEVIVP